MILTLEIVGSAEDDVLLLAALVSLEMVLVADSEKMALVETSLEVEGEVIVPLLPLLAIFVPV